MCIQHYIQTLRKDHENKNKTKGDEKFEIELTEKEKNSPKVSSQTTAQFPRPWPALIVQRRSRLHRNVHDERVAVSMVGYPIRDFG